MKVNSSKSGKRLIHSRILKALAAVPHGCNVNDLLSCGYQFTTISDLVRAGLAVASLDTGKVDGRIVEIARIKISDAGLKLVSTTVRSLASEATSPPTTSRIDETHASMTARTQYLEARLAVATQHIAEGEARICVVRAAIARRRNLGLSSDLPDRLLNTMLDTLSLMMGYKAIIEAAAEHESNELAATLV